MAITFTQERKKQKYLIFVLVVITLLILVVIWWGFFQKEGFQPSSPVIPIFSPPKVEINWQILKDSRLEGLQTFKEIPPFEGEVGRENPFIHY